MRARWHAVSRASKPGRPRFAASGSNSLTQPSRGGVASTLTDLIREDGARRSFSIANRCSYDGIVELHVRLQGAGRFVDSVLDSVIAQAVLWIEGPFCDFRFHRHSQCDRTEAIFVADGTGFGPFKAIIEELVAVGKRRPLHLYWGGRSADELCL